jgi:hypothetical protein
MPKADSSVKVYPDTLARLHRARQAMTSGQRPEPTLDQVLNVLLDGWEAGRVPADAREASR